MQSLRARRDPAPSLLRYRLGRLWLRPSVRRIVMFGPMTALLLGVTFHVATSKTIRAGMAQTVSDLRTAIVGREEFKVSSLAVYGASEDLEAEVVRLAGLTLPMSSLDLDIASLRDRLEMLPSVADAAVRVGSKGVLQITLSQRVPVVIWRMSDGLKLAGADGVVLGEVASRLDRVDLPVIAGMGADAHIPEALELLTMLEPVVSRLRGLQRVGARRWTIVLDREQEIYLPENGAKRALARLMALHASEGLLDKDVAIVDLRDGLRPVLRLGAYAAEVHRPYQLSFEGDGQ